MTSSQRIHRNASAPHGRRTVRLVTLTAGLTAGLFATGCSSSGGTDRASSAPTGSSTATTTGTPASTGPNSSSSAPTAPGTPSRPAATGGDQQVRTAAATALAKLGRGTVTSVDLERGGTEWEVEITTRDGVEHVLRVSHDGTSVISGPRTEPQDSQDRRQNQRELRAAKIDYERAAQKILAARAGTITELNLDDHRGTIVWESDVTRSGTTHEVVIDAGTGNLISNKPDTVLAEPSVNSRPAPLARSQDRGGR